jgi:hypothetical protein
MQGRVVGTVAYAEDDTLTAPLCSSALSSSRAPAVIVAAGSVGAGRGSGVLRGKEASFPFHQPGCHCAASWVLSTINIGAAVGESQ